MSLFRSFAGALRSFFISPAKAATLATTSAAIIYSGFALNQRSLDILAPTQPRMQAIAFCASQKLIAGPRGERITFVVYHGFRTEEEQRGMIARGVSWVNRSRHQDGKAIDVMAVVNGKGVWDAWPYHEIAKAFYSCGDAHGSPVTWGGEWRVKDLVHFEIKT